MLLKHDRPTLLPLLFGSAQAYIPHCKRKNKGTGQNGPATNQEFPMFVSYILSKFRSYMRYRETVRELSLLSDRELDDLGISRFQIESIARQNAFA
jgi:uncharacterized protein YjiS (DUF1127 family)